MKLTGKELKSKAIGGMRWTTIGTVSQTVIQLFRLAILARLLSPKEFGLMAMVSVVIAVGDQFADLGLSSAIIQRKNPSRDELSSLYWLNAICGFTAFLCIFLLSPLIARGFQTTEIIPFLKVASITFVVSSFGIQFSALLRKHLEFRNMTQIEIIQALSASLAAIFLALHGFGVWSLVLGSLLGILLRTCMLATQARNKGWLPNLRFSYGDTKGYLTFGLYRLGTLAAAQLLSRADQIIIGAVMGAVQLGYYNMGFRLIMEPIYKLTPVITKVSFPIFSIAQDDIEVLRKGFFKIIKTYMYILAPVLVGLASVAPEVVPFLIGKQWTPTVPLIRLLGIYGLLYVLVNGNGGLIIAKGKANWEFYWNLVSLAVFPIGILLGAKGGNMAHVCIALILLQIGFFPFRYFLMIRSLLGSVLREYTRVVVPPLLFAGVMGIGVILIKKLLLPLNPAFSLTFQICFGALFYLTSVWILRRDFILDALEMVPISLKFKDKFRLSKKHTF